MRSPETTQASIIETARPKPSGAGVDEIIIMITVIATMMSR
jgi:uncharacterized ferredoxin-like protein